MVFQGGSQGSSQRMAELQKPKKCHCGLEAGGVSRPEGPPRLVGKSAWTCPGAVQAPSDALSTQTQRPAEQGPETLNTRGNASFLCCLCCPVHSPDTP